MEETSVLQEIDKNSYQLLMEEAQRLAHFGGWEVNLITGAVKWSSEMYQMLGYDPLVTKATFNNFVKKLHREDILHVKRNLETLLRFHSNDTYDFRIVNKEDGSIKYLRTGIIVKRNERGLAISMTGFSQDITAQKLAEQKIENINRELNTFFKIIDDVFYSVDIPAFKLIQISHGCEKLFGYSIEEFQADYSVWFKIFHPDDKEIIENGNAKLAAGETIVTQYRIVCKDGAVKWVESKIIPSFDKNGRFIRLDGVTRDITDRKNSEIEHRLQEESLKKSEANLRAVFENSDTAFVLFSIDLNVVSFNTQANDFYLKYVNKNLQAGTYALNYFPKEKRELFATIAEKVKNREIVNYETNYYGKNNEVNWYDVKWAGVLNEQMEYIGILLTFKNITEKKIMELEREKITADLVQRNKDQEQFNYIVSHNLRAPVANLSGLLTLLHDPAIDDEDKKYVVDGISLSVKSLDTVITDMNQVLQVKQLINEIKELNDFEKIVNDIKVSISNIIDKEQVLLNCHFEVASIFTIRSYLYSIFYNLILNSIKYRQNGIAPVITISSAIHENSLQLSFTDNGKGIDLENNGRHLFRLYKRFDTTVEGKGLGLFMVKTQVESLGGTISVKSEIEKGTQFIIRLPI